MRRARCCLLLAVERRAIALGSDCPLELGRTASAAATGARPRLAFPLELLFARARGGVRVRAAAARAGSLGRCGRVGRGVPPGDDDAECQRARTRSAGMETGVESVVATTHLFAAVWVAPGSGCPRAMAAVALSSHEPGPGLWSWWEQKERAERRAKEARRGAESRVSATGSM